MADNFGSEKFKEDAEKEGWVSKPIERPKPIENATAEDAEERKRPVFEGCIARNQISKLQAIARAVFGRPEHAQMLNEFLKQHFQIESVERVPKGSFDTVAATLSDAMKRQARR